MFDNEITKKAMSANHAKSGDDLPEWTWKEGGAASRSTIYIGAGGMPVDATDEAGLSAIAKAGALQNISKTKQYWLDKQSQLPPPEKWTQMDHIDAKKIQRNLDTLDAAYEGQTRTAQWKLQAEAETRKETLSELEKLVAELEASKPKRRL